MDLIRYGQQSGKDMSGGWRQIYSEAPGLLLDEGDRIAFLMAMGAMDVAASGPKLRDAVFGAPGMPQAKVPNPGGRLGDAQTRATAQKVVADLKAKGYTDVRQEVMFEKGLGGVKTRYADIVAKNPTTGETVIVNIGKMRSDGVPIMRERQAMDDIIFSPSIQEHPNSRMIFIEKGASGLPPGFK